MIVMIPGPIELAPEVRDAMATPATSHIAPSFMSVFSSTLKLLRLAFRMLFSF